MCFFEIRGHAVHVPPTGAVAVAGADAAPRPAGAGSTLYKEAPEKLKVCDTSPGGLREVWASRRGRGGAGGDQAGGGPASFTARQALLISRTNSHVSDLETICNPE